MRQEFISYSEAHPRMHAPVLKKELNLFTIFQSLNNPNITETYANNEIPTVFKTMGWSKYSYRTT